MTVGHLAIPDRPLADFCRHWKVRELSVFGSVLRDDFSSDSDVDVLVSFDSNAAWSLFDIVNMRQELRRCWAGLWTSSRKPACGIRSDAPQS